MSPANEITAHNILALRNYKNWTQQDFGKQFGVKRITINAQESGLNKPKIKQVQAMAAYFNITVEQFYGQKLTERDLNGSNVPPQMELELVKKENMLLHEQLEIMRKALEDKDKLIRLLEK